MVAFVDRAVGVAISAQPVESTGAAAGETNQGNQNEEAHELPIGPARRRFSEYGSALGRREPVPFGRIENQARIWDEEPIGQRRAFVKTSTKAGQTFRGNIKRSE